MIFRSWQVLAIMAAVPWALWAIWPPVTDIAEVEARSGSYGRAISLYERELATHPDNGAVRLKLIAAYERTGRPGQAFMALEASPGPLTPRERVQLRRLALAIGKPGRSVRRLLGQVRTFKLDERHELVDLALMANDQVTARQVQQGIVAAYPMAATEWVRLRDLALAGEKLQLAIDSQKQLYTRFHHRPDGDRLVTLLLQGNRTKDALALLETLAPAGPQLAWHQRCLELAGWADDPAAALRHLRPSYALTHDPAIGGRLLVLLAQQKAPDLVAFARALADAHTQDASLQGLIGYTLVTAGHTDVAFALIAAAVARRPADPAAHAALMTTALGAARPALAEAELRRWLLMRPDDVAARHEMAQMQVWSDRMAEGWQSYERLFAQSPTHPQAMQWRQEWLAISAPVDDLTPGGLANLGHLVAAQPRQAAWRRRLAEANLQAGNGPAAVDDYRVLVRLPEATLADALQLNRVLGWYGKPLEAWARLRQLAANGGVPQQVLRDAAFQAPSAPGWELSAGFLARLVRRLPDDRSLWMDYARVQERQGDLAGAVASWRHRLTLGGATPAMRLGLVNLLLRQQRADDALALLEGLRGQASVAELLQRASLAVSLNNLTSAETALHLVVRRSPADMPSRLAWIDVLRRLRRDDDAEAAITEALRLAPEDVAVMVQAAAAAQYGPRFNPERAAGLVSRLAALPHPPDDALLLMADHYQGRDPRAGARALDAYHARYPGTAGTWLRRGDTALVLQDRMTAQKAWRQATVMGTAPRAAGADREAAAWAFDHLGAGAEALAIWQELAGRTPPRLAPLVAMARHYLTVKQFVAATPFVERAMRLSPDDPDALLLQADWLSAADRLAEAVPIYDGLHRRLPGSAPLAVAAASARYQLQRFLSARALGGEAYDLQLGDAGLMDFYRGLRDAGGHPVRPYFLHEASSVLTQTTTGVGGSWLINDQMRLHGEVAWLHWDGGLPASADAGLGLDWQSGAWRAGGAVGLGTLGTVVQAPFGSLHAGWNKGPFDASLTVQTKRWDEARQSVAQGGRDDRLMAHLRWSPDARLTLQGRATLDRLSLPGGQA
ncbi:MAG: tetratricopeptide repeat protein, partial [Candidatus Sericytochromatia bacterium]|nr:tetratricopeptide repeat protein [Candidatus Sericytochromatia bacterium]